MKLYSQQQKNQCQYAHYVLLQQSACEYSHNIAAMPKSDITHKKQLPHPRSINQC